MKPEILRTNSICPIGGEVRLRPNQ